MKYKPNEAEWNNLIRGNKLTSTIHLQRWAIIHTSKNSQNAQSFVETLFKVARPMDFRMEKPKTFFEYSYNFNFII